MDRYQKHVRFIQLDSPDQVQIHIGLDEDPLDIYVSKVINDRWKDEHGRDLYVLTDGGRLDLNSGDHRLLAYLTICSRRLGYCGSTVIPKRAMMAKYGITRFHSLHSKCELVSSPVNKSHFYKTLAQFTAIMYSIKGLDDYHRLSGVFQ